MTSEPNLVVAELARILDDLGIHYAVGGSVASSMYGDPRSTQDVDFVAAIAPREVQGRGDGLDDAYLDRWATPLGVADLLARARES